VPARRGEPREFVEHPSAERSGDPEAPRADESRTLSDMPDDDREVLQRFMDNLFREAKRVSRLDVILRAETLDLDRELMPIIENLPSRASYTRQTLADQLNSAIVGHGWSRRYGTVE
jgi:hypothetical protein